MQGVEIHPLEDKTLPILHSQYHGVWCPGDAKSQGISSQAIDLICLKYSGSSIKSVIGMANLFPHKQS